MIRAGDIEGALQNFYEGIEGDGSWRRVPAAAKQQLRDNALTFLGQINEQRRPYTLADAQAIRTPTLLIGGGATTGSLSVMWRVLAEHIAGAQTAVIPECRPLDVRAGAAGVRRGGGQVLGGVAGAGAVHFLENNPMHSRRPQQYQWLSDPEMTA